MTRLVADIGGTNARFALADAACALGDAQVLRVADFGRLVDAAQAYLRGRRPDEAVIAVALPVTGDLVKFTNAPWTFSIGALRTELGVLRLHVINDFVAQALAIPALADDAFDPLNPGRPDPAGAIAVLGPGTGLGVAGLLPSPLGWRPIPSEGGHASFAPGNEEEIALLRVLLKRFGHVSHERLLSGPGLVALAEAHAELGHRRLPPADPATVVARAADEPDCAAALRTFSAVLGSFAGDTALTFNAAAGVFLAGGILPRLGELFDRALFLQRFRAKGRFDRYLEAIPVKIVLREEPGLLGAAAYRFEE